MTMSRDALSDTLVDVRKAYRLIHAYQRRVWDLLRVIDLSAANAGLAFKGWKPMNVNPPPKSKTKFFVGRWAWDFLPAYDLGCEWEKTEKKGTRRVYVIARADTGYDARGEGEPDASTFTPAEEGATEVRIGLWTASTATPDWRGAWQEVEAKIKRREDETYTLTVKGVTYRYRYARVNVADLVDEAAVKARVLAPIERWLAAPVAEVG